MTEFEPAGASTSTAAVAASTAAQQGAVLTSGYHPPRRDLGSRPVNVTCPYCTRTGKTRTNYNCGDVSNYMEIAYYVHMNMQLLILLIFDTSLILSHNDVYVLFCYIHTVYINQCYHIAIVLFALLLDPLHMPIVSRC